MYFSEAIPTRKPLLSKRSPDGTIKGPIVRVIPSVSEADRRYLYDRLLMEDDLDRDAAEMLVQRLGSIENQLQRLSSDVSYLKGRDEGTRPRAELDQRSTNKRLDELERKQTGMFGYLKGVVAASVGAAAVVSYIFQLLGSMK